MYTYSYIYLRVYIYMVECNLIAHANKYFHVENIHRAIQNANWGF